MWVKIGNARVDVSSGNLAWKALRDFERVLFPYGCYVESCPINEVSIWTREEVKEDG